MQGVVSFVKITFMGKRSRNVYQKSEIVAPKHNQDGLIWERIEPKTVSFWHILLSFIVGVIVGLVILLTYTYWRFEKTYENRLYPGIKINGINLGGKTPQEVANYFSEKNKYFAKTQITFFWEEQAVATTSGKTLNIGYDQNLVAQQAYLLGRGPYLLSNLILKFKAYSENIDLPIVLDFDKAQAEKIFANIAQQTDLEPKDALFTFANGRVTAFHPSSTGRKLNRDKTLQQLDVLVKNQEFQPKNNLLLKVVVETVKPKISTEEANNLGIKELIGVGTSTFLHSIPNRVYNISLAASRLNGLLVPPGDTFSFNKNLGDISSFTGYKSAYVIQNGRTVLGDGGGVCQVSTTFFRAALNTGLPIVERWPHAYRVGYYEQDQPPGLDASIFSPVNDFKFKNDTPSHILIQTVFDPSSYRLTVYFYGQKDNRVVLVSKPLITNQAPPPPDAYQDDPSLPKGEVKQVDFAAPGAKSTFFYEVKKDGKTIFNKTFVSNYRPWQAVYLRGTKE